MKSKMIGDVLHTEHPFAHVIASKERGKRCDECLTAVRVGELKRCSACHAARYCSTACQKGENKKITCEYLGKNRCFEDLMNHKSDIQADHARCEEFAELCYTLRLFVGEEYDLPTPDELLDIYGKMIINTFSICSPEMQPIGAAIYLGASILDHSCAPNAVAVFSGTEIHVRATENIPNVDVEDIFVSYIELLSPTAVRQKELEQQYYFTCECPVCLDEEKDQLVTAAKCPTPDCNTAVHQDTQDDKFLPCQTCNRSHFPKDFHEQIETASTQAKELLTKCKKWKAEGDASTVFSSCEEYVLQYGQTLHGNNAYMVQIVDRLFDACIDMEKWDQAIDYGRKNEKPYRLIYPQYHPMIGVHLLKLGKILLFREKLEDALKTLQQAETVVGVSHGSEHSLYKGELMQLLDQCQEEMRGKLEAGGKGDGREDEGEEEED